jgi:hypothetical protein
VEYQRKRWEINREVAQAHVETFASLSKQLEEDPINHVKRTWEFDKEYSDKKVAEFKGPDDPRYRDHLKERYIEGLKSSMDDLEKIMKARP